MATTQELLARLRDLTKSAGENYYERIQIADQLLSDRQWVESEHGGSDHKAAKTLEDVYFHDLCGLMGLWDLIHILRKYPQRKEWEKFKYNLRKMHESLKPEPAKVDPPRRATIKELEQLQDTNESLKFQLNRQKEIVATIKQELVDWKSRAEKLEKRVAVLELENATLKGRLEELEAVLERLAPSTVA